MVTVFFSASAGQARGEEVDGLQEAAEDARHDCQARAEAQAQDPVPREPPGEVEATLLKLHEAFQELDNYVDVYRMSTRDPGYQALFLGSIPAEAHEVDTPVPTGLMVLEDAPTTGGPGDETNVPTVEDTTCNGIRPGTWASGCSASFMFTDGTNLYIGSAGHCFEEGSRVRLGTQGQAGTVVFRMAGGIGQDFALIRIDDDQTAAASPELCFWGGPTQGNKGSLLGEAIVSDGHGRPPGVSDNPFNPPRPRAGVGWSWGAQSYMWFGSKMGGDSGAAVATKAGDAVGTHTHSLPGPDAVAWGTRWDVGMQAAEDALDLDLELVTTSEVNLGLPYPPS